MLLLAVGCVAQPPERFVAGRREALGVPRDGFPNWAERTILVLTNRARCDPAADLADCSDDRCKEKACYEPVPPLGWNHRLGRAARFHAANLSDVCGGRLQHDSPCDLVADLSDRYEPGSCDGRAECACEPGTARCGYRGTSAAARVGGRFGAPYQGENIAAGGGDPRGTFYLWFHEPAADDACAFSLSNGHRWNILNGRHRSLGVGVAGRIAAQDFGGGPTPSGLVSGTHYPSRGPDVTFWANWYAEAAPAEAVVNMNGVCRALSLERGTETNGTFALQASVPSGCVPYRFEFRGADGTAHVVPDTGAYGIGCEEDWLPDPPARCGCTPSCAGRVCGDDGCGGSCGRCAAGRACEEGRCVAPSADAAMPGPGDGGGRAADGGAPERDAGEVGEGTVRILRDGGIAGEAVSLRPGCTCSAGRGRDAWAGVWLAWLVLAWLRRRGRLELRRR